jgi:endonuclease I
MRDLFTIILLSNFFTSFAGTITKSLTTLSGFGNVYPYHSSTSLRYTVSGSSLTSDLVVSADSSFEVSLNYPYGYSKSITLTQVSGTVATTTIYVRFSPSAIGSATGNIVNSSAGSTTQNVAVSGTCIAWAIPTSPSNYYSTATGRNATLKTNLYSKIQGHTAVGYSPGVWNAYTTTDIQFNNTSLIWDVYSTLYDIASPYEFTIVTDQDAGSGGTVEGDKYNREHSFPQSWFATSSPMVSDIHHIFATDKKVNNARSNYPYGTVSSPTFTSLIGGKLGPNTSSPLFTSTVFEPIDEYKGDIARAQLYMATRYDNLIGGWSGNGNANDVLAGNTYPAYDAWYVDLLVAWNNLDPVSDKEIKRNNAIYAIQNNRNPFIDSPQFVQRIWGGSIPTEPIIAASNLAVTNNSNTNITLNWKSGNGNRRVVLVKSGSAVNSFPVDTFQYSANSNYTSATQLGTGNYIVYNGTGSTVTISNLTQGTTYHFAVIEYNGWYTMANYQSSGYLTSNTTTLPVDLVSFTGEKENNHVLLKWSTASEVNNDHFTIERSINLKQWKTAGTVNGAGNSSRKLNYLIQDPLPEALPEILYYRLRQTDFDGTFTYSKTVSVNTGKDVPVEFSVSPNPFSDVLRISFQHIPDGEMTVTVKNLMGSIYVKKKVHIEYGNQQYFDLNDLGNIPGGIYLLQLEYGKQVSHYKLIKN